MADIVDADFAILERGEAKRGGNEGRTVLRHQARTGSVISGFAGRCALRGSAMRRKAAKGEQEADQKRDGTAHHLGLPQSAGCPA